MTIIDPSTLPRHTLGAGHKAKRGPARKAAPFSPTKFLKDLAWHRGPGHKRLTAHAAGSKGSHL